jgi:hypothetical protein
MESLRIYDAIVMMLCMMPSLMFGVSFCAQDGRDSYWIDEDSHLVNPFFSQNPTFLFRNAPDTSENHKKTTR